ESSHRYQLGISVLQTPKPPSSGFVFAPQFCESDPAIGPRLSAGRPHVAGPDWTLAGRGLAAGASSACSGADPGNAGADRPPCRRYAPPSIIQGRTMTQAAFPDGHFYSPVVDMAEAASYA